MHVGRLLHCALLPADNQPFAMHAMSGSGALSWWVSAGPSGDQGGSEWGSASDNTRVYVAIANSFAITTTLINPVPNQPGNSTAPTWTDGGTVVAVDARNGAILWTFANPLMGFNLTAAGNASVDNSTANHHAFFVGPVSVANGVVFAPSLDPEGTLFYLDAATGHLLGSFPTGATTMTGPSVVQGWVYTGTGYTRWGTPGNKFYALSV